MHLFLSWRLSQWQSFYSMVFLVQVPIQLRQQEQLLHWLLWCLLLAYLYQTQTSLVVVQRLAVPLLLLELRLQLLLKLEPITLQLIQIAHQFK